MARRIGRPDRLIGTLDEGLRTLFAPPRVARPSPADRVADSELSTDDVASSIALMRVNRAGEISAQALYSGQALGARSPATLIHLQAAAADESDHLAWCTDRLRELGGSPSLLDPLWYTGSLVIGIAAGVAGDATSLGFVAETERQVEAHLDDHLDRLPTADVRSRTILEQMRADEARHGTDAELAGGRRPGRTIRSLMALGGGILRRSTLYV